jgi:hypothetical protein
MTPFNHWFLHALAEGQELHSIKKPSTEELAKRVFQKGLNCPSERYFLWGLGQDDDWNLIDPF